MANPISPVSPYSEDDKKPSTVPFHASCPQCHHFFNHIDIVLPVGPDGKVDVLCPICGHLHCRLGRSSTQDTILSQETIHDPNSLLAQPSSTRSTLSIPLNSNPRLDLQSPPETPNDNPHDSRQNVTSIPTLQWKDSPRHPKIQVDTPTPLPNSAGKKRKIDVTSPTLGRAKNVWRALRSIKRPRFFTKRTDAEENQQSSPAGATPLPERPRPTTVPVVTPRRSASRPEVTSRCPSFDDPKTAKRRFRTGLSQAQHRDCHHDKICHGCSSLTPFPLDPLPISALSTLHGISRDGAQPCLREPLTDHRVVPELSIPSDTSLSLQEIPASPASSIEFISSQAPVDVFQSGSLGPPLDIPGFMRLPSVRHEDTTANTPDLSFGSSTSSTDIHTTINTNAFLRPNTPLLQTDLNVPNNENEVDEGDGDLTPTQPPRRQSPASPEDFHGVGGWAHAESRP